MKKETLTKTKKGLHHCMMRKMPFFPRPYHKASLPRKTRNMCYIQYKKLLRTCNALKGIKTFIAFEKNVRICFFATIVFR